ncbi:hypothetical protein BDZ91DRAFT_294177 [Kalaharituber pfeilii]|nr:hypothetical protein BDZ91DRAFT_294177 [Kalaharituber pfeilii]
MQATMQCKQLLLKTVVCIYIYIYTTAAPVPHFLPFPPSSSSLNYIPKPQTPVFNVTSKAAFFFHTHTRKHKNHTFSLAESAQL